MNLQSVTITRTQTDPATGRQVVERWTREADGLTAVRLHQSGALMVFCGVDDQPTLVLSFGAWSEYACA